MLYRDLLDCRNTYRNGRAQKRNQSQSDLLVPFHSVSSYRLEFNSTQGTIITVTCAIFIIAYNPVYVNTVSIKYKSKSSVLSLELSLQEVSRIASRIRGITVEIGGDTTKLSKALEGVNKNIKNTQTQLKDVEKLLKLDPTNTELLSQKQKLLADAVTATKEKLEVLKTAAEQANTALANGEISQQQYDALQREIIETENELKRLTTEANNSHTALEKMGVLGETLQFAGDKISGVGQKLLPVTAGVTALGTIAVKTGADFDSAMSKVAAVSGATGSEMDALREKAREMGSKTKFSASEAADAMNYMAMAGWKTNDMLSGIEGIMNLAAASGEDLASTSDIVTDALTAFGLSASDSGHFADILAAASSNANTNVSMMGETFKYAAPVLGSLGYSAEDSAIAIGLMANAGIKSSQAGTALRSAITNLAKPTGTVASAMEQYGISLTDSSGKMYSLRELMEQLRQKLGGLSEAEQAQAAASLFGKEAMSGMLAIINGSPADFEKLSNAIDTCSDTVDGYNGTTEKMAAVMQDRTGKNHLQCGSSFFCTNNNRAVNQTNNSLKSLSRLEINRQTKNAVVI